jgi:hypothetical protein
MTRADEDESESEPALWGPLIDAIGSGGHEEDSQPFSTAKTLLDAACWVAGIFLSLVGSLHLLMLVLFGDPTHHLGIFALGCLATISGYASSFGIMNCSPGRGPLWILPAALLFWLDGWAFSLPQARGFIH